jgi:antitoxin component of MazEF toxin-antitoxin module
MIKQRLRRVGNSYVITIPKVEVERNGWQVGQRFTVELTLLDSEDRPVLSPRIRKAFEESWARNEEGYRYLADR